MMLKIFNNNNNNLIIIIQIKCNKKIFLIIIIMLIMKNQNQIKKTQIKKRTNIINSELALAALNIFAEQ